MQSNNTLEGMLTNDCQVETMLPSTIYGCTKPQDVGPYASFQYYDANQVSQGFLCGI